MTPFPVNFRSDIERHVARSGVVLPAATVDELAAYLEDLYSAALDEGLSAEARRRRARIWWRNRRP
jgi:hypothetical protein